MGRVARHERRGHREGAEQRPPGHDAHEGLHVLAPLLVSRLQHEPHHQVTEKPEDDEQRGANDHAAFGKQRGQHEDAGAE